MLNEANSAKQDDYWFPPPPEESHKNKFLRKVKENPLVPIGMLATVGALVYGVSNFLIGNQKKQQYAMRGRVVAQGATVIALVGGLIFAAIREQNEKK